MMRYVSYARIYVYQDISKDLPTSIKLLCHDEEWIQEIDYEHIPSRCRWCHEHGYLFHECPQNRMQPLNFNTAKEKDAEGFENVGYKHRSNKRQTAPKSSTKSQSPNRYEAVNTIIKEGQGSKDQKDPKEQQCEEIQMKNKEQKHNERTSQGLSDMESVNEDMELGNLDLDGIQRACDNLTNGYIPFEQIALLQEAIIKTKAVRGLGVVSEPMKGGERKKRGHRPNAKRIRDVEGKLVVSRQYPTRTKTFKLLNKVNP